MLSNETVLRQRYSLSFLTTTLLIALTTQSSLAFSINPLGPVGATQNWDPDESYNLTDQRTGITRLNPTAVQSLTRGGTVGFLLTLDALFPNWIFKPAVNDLAGSFEVRTYAAQGTPARVGAELQLEYIPDGNDPTPLGNSLHWIQRVFNNHSAASNLHNDYALIIDIAPGVINPFYDTGYAANERMFYDFPGRPDAGNNHFWSAELYLVEENSPQNVTIYNGIQWGWNNEVVPEPLTIFGSGMGLGLGVLFKKYSRKESKKPQKAKTLA
jgi:hypothetical protein